MMSIQQELGRQPIGGIGIGLGHQGADQSAARKAFIDECAFAKVVRTNNGDAILVSGTVIEVKSRDARHIEWIVEALRSNTLSQRSSER